MKRFHILSFLLALSISSILWFMVIGRELVDTIVEMRLDYRGIPSDVVVRSGLENKVRVRVRGPQGLIANLNTKNEAHIVDLSKIKAGNNIVPLEIESPHTAFSIMEISPATLELEVDTIAEKVVPVLVKYKEPLSSDVIILSTNVSEPTITVKGPEKILEGIKNVPILIEIPKNTQGGIFSTTASPKLPRDVEAIPSSIIATVDFQITTKTLTITQKVEVRGVEGIWQTTVKPEDINVKVTVPASMKLSDIQKNIEVYVVLPRFIKEGATRLPVRVQGTENIQIISIQPKVSTVTLIQQEP